MKAGQTRLLATMDDKRSAKFAGVPTLKELGYDFVNDAIYSIVCPASIEPAVVKKLQEAFAKAAKNEQFLASLDLIDLVPLDYDGKKLEDFLKVNWKKINTHLIATGLIKEAATLPE
jgi:tripartite-type tricarboxylate transporter receptor subunit TctC